MAARHSEGVNVCSKIFILVKFADFVRQQLDNIIGRLPLQGSNNNTGEALKAHPASGIESERECSLTLQDWPWKRANIHCIPSVCFIFEGEEGEGPASEWPNGKSSSEVKSNKIQRQGSYYLHMKLKEGSRLTTRSSLTWLRWVWICTVSLPDGSVVHRWNI